MNSDPRSKDKNEEPRDTTEKTMRDVDAAARARGTTRAKAMAQDEQKYNQPPEYKQGPMGTGGRQAGYRETQGSGYDDSDAGEQEEQTQQQEYDPAQSGVRKAQNKPGTRVDTPGRETGTAWGENQQMGSTTDTPDRRNPAN